MASRAALSQFSVSKMGRSANHRRLFISIKQGAPRLGGGAQGLTEECEYCAPHRAGVNESTRRKQKAPPLGCGA
jgi:hypothetical protein